MDAKNKYALIDELNKSNIPVAARVLLENHLNGIEIPEESLLLTREQACQLLNIGKTRFYELVKKEAISAVDLLGTKRYQRTQINNLSQTGFMGLIIEMYRIDLDLILENLNSITHEP